MSPLEKLAAKKLDRTDHKMLTQTLHPILVDLKVANLTRTQDLNKCWKNQAPISLQLGCLILESKKSTAASYRPSRIAESAPVWADDQHVDREKKNNLG